MQGVWALARWRASLRWTGWGLGDVDEEGNLVEFDAERDARLWALVAGCGLQDYLWLRNVCWASAAIFVHLEG